MSPLSFQGVKWLEHMIPRALPWAKRQAGPSARIRRPTEPPRHEEAGASSALR